MVLTSICTLLLQQEAIAAHPAPSFEGAAYLQRGIGFDHKLWAGKVVLVMSYPTFCCGFDFAAKIAKETKDKYKDRGLAVLGVFYGTYDEEQRKSWDEVTKSIKIDWPILYDKDSKIIKAIYPNESTQYTFCFIDRKGQVRVFKMNDLKDVVPCAEKLLSETTR